MQVKQVLLILGLIKIGLLCTAAVTAHFQELKKYFQFHLLMEFAVCNIYLAYNVYTEGYSGKCKFFSDWMNYIYQEFEEQGMFGRLFSQI